MQIFCFVIRVYSEFQISEYIKEVLGIHIFVRTKELMGYLLIKNQFFLYQMYNTARIFHVFC